MNFNQASEWLKNRNLKHDIEIVVDSSKKWRGKKLTTFSGNKHIPSKCKTGSDLIEYLSTYKTIIESQIQRIQRDLPKHINLCLSFLETCTNNHSILKSNAELQKVIKFDEQVKQEFEKITAKLSRFYLDIEIVEGRLKHPFDVNELIDTFKNDRYKGTGFYLIQNLAYIAHVKLDIKKNQEPVSIIFTKDEMIKLQQLILECSKLDVSDSLTKMWHTVSSTFKYFDRKISTLNHQKLNQPNVSEDEATVAEFIQGTGTGGSHIESEEGYSIFYFQSSVIEFVMLLRNIVQLMERTDSWLSSKNV